MDSLKDLPSVDLPSVDLPSADSSEDLQVEAAFRHVGVRPREEYLGRRTSGSENRVESDPSSTCELYLPTK